MTLNDWIDIWIVTYKKPFVVESTLELIDYCLVHILNSFNGRNISNIKGYEIQQFLLMLCDIPNMQDKCRKYMNEIFEYAYRNRIIDFNPMKAVKMRPYYTINTKIFTEQERYLFMNSIKGKPYELLYTAYMCTGARKSELILKDSLDIDFNNKLVYIYGTKTRYSKRVMPLFDKFANALNLVDDYKKYFNSYKPNYAYLLFTRHCKRVGLQGYCVRSLRSTFSNLCYEVGVREKTIQAWLGHSGRTTTSRYYIKSDRITISPNQHILKEIELVNSIL